MQTSTSLAPLAGTDVCPNSEAIYHTHPITDNFKSEQHSKGTNTLRKKEKILSGILSFLLTPCKYVHTQSTFLYIIPWVTRCPCYILPWGIKCPCYILLNLHIALNVSFHGRVKHYFTPRYAVYAVLCTGQLLVCKDRLTTEQRQEHLSERLEQVHLS